MMQHKKIIICLYVLTATMMQAYHENSVLDVLFKTSFQHVFNLGHDNILLSLDHNQNLLSYRATYPFSSIGLSGFYRLASQVAGPITIGASNVTLDLNGNTVMGGITIASGLSNVALKNGIIDVSSSLIDGIVVNSGCNSIAIDNVLVRSGRCGISCSGSRACTITNCEMTLNITGIRLDSCSNIIMKGCTAARNSVTGFGLLLSTTCSLTGCNALATGFNNIQVTNATICGFLSANGFSNVFDACIANGTQALTTTDFNSVVAGFVLTGTEQLSCITNCQANNASTNGTGVTVPHGILLQGTVSSLTSLTAISTGSLADSVSSLAWSSDGAYLAVGGTLGAGDLKIYQFNPLNNALVLTATLDLGLTATVFSAPWSPDNRYLAVAGDFDGNDLRVVQFTTENQSLLQVASVSTGSLSDIVYTAAWSPNGNYIAVGGQLTTDDIRLYFMDRINVSLTFVTSVNFGSASDIVRTVAWSPDGRFLAAGGTAAGSELKIYFFNSATTQFSQIASVDFSSDTILSIAWSPDGSYVAAGGTLTANDLNMYRFSLIGTTYTLTPVTSAIGTTSVFALSWSPDGRFLAVGGLLGANDLQVYFFDRGSLTLQLMQSVSPSGVGNDVIQAVQWSPDGTVIATGGTLTGNSQFDVYLMQGLQFPSANIISNNIISNNSGALFPSGIGLSGSSIANIMIGNTSYNNPNSPWMVYTNYAGVCNVFNQLFFQAPTLLQNVQGSSTTPILIPDDYNARMGRVLSLVDDIQTKVNILVAGSPL